MKDKTHYKMKLKEFADNNFKFDGYGSKLSKRVENIVGKGEVARYEQFFLFPQCFQKTCFPGASKGVIVWEWANKILSQQLTHDRSHIRHLHNGSILFKLLPDDKILD